MIYRYCYTCNFCKKTYINLSVYFVSIYLSRLKYHSIHLYLFIYLSVYLLSICQYKVIVIMKTTSTFAKRNCINIYTCLFIFLSIYLVKYQSIYLFICLSIIYLPIYSPMNNANIFSF